MKKITLFTAFFGLFFCGKIAAQCTTSDLIISYYLEGSTNNKCIEIYNGTNASIDLTATAYKIKIFLNGATMDPVLIQLTGGTIASGDVWVVCHSSTTVYTGDQTSMVLGFSGNDAVVLVDGDDNILDSFGKVGENPSPGWGASPCSSANRSLEKPLSGNAACIVDLDPSNAFLPSDFTGTSGNPPCRGLDNITGLGAAALPIELKRFFGLRQKDGSVQLNWTTLTEKLAKSFEIERADRPLSDRFEKITSLAAAGESSSELNYDFLDREAPTNAYYRLKMVDLDGNFKFSNIISLKNKETALVIKDIFPNPTTDMATIRFNAATESTHDLSIFDVSGRRVWAESFDAQKGEQLREVSLGGLPNGFYLLEISNGIEKTFQKLMKTGGN
jgi:Secretion system C-terminal sorting domain/Lamin Tail Domain